MSYVVKVFDEDGNPLYLNEVANVTPLLQFARHFSSKDLASDFLLKALSDRDLYIPITSAKAVKVKKKKQKTLKEKNVGHQGVIDLPQVIYARDYHEFKAIDDMFSDLGSNVRVEEIGFEGSEYVGVVYAEKDDAYWELVNSYKED
jgi:hypothetical protein